MWDAIPGAIEAPGSALLLDGDAPEVFIPARSRDLQVRFGRPGSGRARAVVICTRADDPDTDELSVRFAAAGVALVRIDSDRACDAVLDWDGRELLIELDGRRFEPSVVWLRHFAAAARPTAGLHERAAQHAREQWAAWCVNLAALPHAAVVNAGARTFDAPNRLAQLAYAQARGLSTPRSVVTSDPAAALAALPGDGDLLVKAVGPHYVELPAGRAQSLLPRRMSRAEFARAGRQSAPLLVQDHIAHEHELRVFVVAGRCLAFRVVKPGPDAYGRDPDAVTVAPCDLDGATAARLAGLMADGGLQIGAVDLLSTPDGFVFLEVNASGSWAWFEQRTSSTAVSAAITRELVALHEVRS
ncbi:MAG: ATP-grasp domain-containing protein [Solirubrobacteraceae bacterium]